MTHILKRRTTAIALVAGLFAPVAAHAEGPALTAKEFVRKAAASNEFEIEAAKIALERARDEAAKSFAKDMITDHGQAGAALAKAASGEHIDMPQDIDNLHHKQLDALRGSSETDFDQAYLSTQVTAHEDAVTLFEDYVRQSERGQIKAFAEKTLGTLRAHNVRIHGLTKE
jgi:putative membrane protein